MNIRFDSASLSVPVSLSFFLFRSIALGRGAWPSSRRRKVKMHNPYAPRQKRPVSLSPKRGWIGLSLVLSGSLAQAEDLAFISSPPLATVVTDAVKPCQTQPVLQTPIITWGGDVATIAAASGAAQSAAGSLFDVEKVRVNLRREDVFANQLRQYLTCQSPLLRGTMGMLNMAAEATG